MAKFTSDNQPPSKGRKKGSINKSTKQSLEAYEQVMLLLEARMTNNKDVISKLAEGRAAELYANLLNYKKAKISKNLNDTTIDGNITINVKFDDNNQAE